MLDRRKQELQEQEYHAALICSVLANVNRGKGQKAYKPQDFMRKEKKKMTPQQLYKMLELITIANGGEVNGNDSW